MNLQILLVTLLASVNAIAFPLEARVDEAKLTSPEPKCYIQNMEPAVSRFNCPKKLKLDQQGTCVGGIQKGYPESSRGAGCMAYCEVRIAALFGREEPYGNAYCRAKSSCMIRLEDSVTLTKTYEFNFKLEIPKARRDTGNATKQLDIRDDKSKGSMLKAGFSLGGTITWSTAIMHSQALSHNYEMGENECGYVTFVPKLMESCGTLTEAEAEPISAFGYPVVVAHRCKKSPKYLTNTANYCNTLPYLNGDGKVAGNVVLVKVDCKTNKLLPMSMQDPIYQWPGVSSIEQSLVAAWGNSTG